MRLRGILHDWLFRKTKKSKAIARQNREKQKGQQIKSFEKSIETEIREYEKEKHENIEQHPLMGLLYVNPETKKSEAIIKKFMEGKHGSINKEGADVLQQGRINNNQEVLQG
jgi:hypothetical protein